MEALERGGDIAQAMQELGDAVQQQQPRDRDPQDQLAGVLAGDGDYLYFTVQP